MNSSMLLNCSANWADILRVASTMAAGTMRPSQILRKLAAYPRQNELAAALREVGRIERSLFMLDWTTDPDMRRRAQVGLNKGEAHHALKRAINFHQRGELRDRTGEGQHYRIAGLNLLAAIIIYWNTQKLSEAVFARQKADLETPAEFLTHVSPLGWEHINLTGEYRWPGAGPRTTLNVGFRPLPQTNPNRRALTPGARAGVAVRVVGLGRSARHVPPAAAARARDRNRGGRHRARTARCSERDCCSWRGCGAARSARYAGPTSPDSTDGDGVLVTVPRSKTNSGRRGEQTLRFVKDGSRARSERCARPRVRSRATAWYRCRRR